MNDDLLIGIGADLSSFNQSIKNVKRLYDNMVKTIASGDAVSIKLDTKTYLNNLKEIERKTNKLREDVEKEAISLGLDLEVDKQLISATVTHLKKAVAQSEEEIEQIKIKSAYDVQRKKELIEKDALQRFVNDQKQFAIAEQARIDKSTQAALGAQKQVAQYEQMRIDDSTRDALAAQKQVAQYEQARVDESTRNALAAQKQVAQYEQMRIDDSTRDALAAQKQVAEYEQMRIDDSTRDALAAQKQVALKEQARIDKSTRAALDAQKQVALKEQARIDKSTRAALDAQKQIALAEQTRIDKSTLDALAAQKQVALAEQKRAKADVNRIISKKAYAIKTKYIYDIMETQKHLNDSEYKREVARLNTLTNSKLRKIKIVATAQTTANIKTARATVATTTKLNQGSTNWDFAGHRGLIDSTIVVAKYGLISQALFGVQNAFRDAGAEMMRFDQSIKDNMAVLQKTETEARMLAKAVTDAGIAFGIELTEVQEGLLVIGRAGVDDTEELMKATKGLAALSVITGDAMSYGAKAMASMLIVYPELSDNMDDLADKMGAVANATRLSLEDFATISNYALTASKNIGLTSDAYLTLQGSMSKVGVSASSIGTSMARLEKLTLDQSGAMQGFYSSIGLSQTKLAKGLKENSEEYMPALIKQLSEARKDTDSWNAGTGKLEIRVRRLVNTLAEIGDLDVYTKMNTEVKTAESVILNATLAAEGLERQWIKIKNVFSEQIQLSAPDFIAELSKFMPDEKTIRSVFSSIISGLQTVFEIAQRVAVVMAASFSIKILVGIRNIALAMKTAAAGMVIFSLATKSASIWMTALSIATKFGPHIIAIGLLVGAYQLWNSEAEDAVEKQAKLTKALRVTTKQINDMTVAQQNRLKKQLDEEEEKAYRKLSKAINLLAVAEKRGENVEGREAAVHDLADELRLITDKQLKVKQVIDEQLRLNSATGESKGLTADLTRSVAELAMETAKAARAAYDMAKGFNAAVLAFDQAMVSFKVQSGLMTSEAASAEKYALSTAAIHEASTVKMKEYNALIKAGGELDWTNDKKKKDHLELLFAAKKDLKSFETQAITALATRNKEQHAIQMKEIADKTQATITAAKLASAITSKDLSPKAYVVEQKRLVKETYDITIKGLNKEIVLAKKRGAINEQNSLIAKRNVAIADHAQATAAEINTLKKQAIADEKALASGASNTTKELKQQIALYKEKATLAISEYNLNVAKEGRLLTEVELNRQLLESAYAEYIAKKDAYDLALSQAGGSIEGNEVSIQKKLMALKTDMNNAQTKHLKEVYKQVLKFENMMRSAGESFADSLLGGDIKGAFKGLFKDILKVFADPLKKSFSELFGKKMEGTIGGFYDALTGFMEEWATNGFASAMKVATGNATAGIANQASSGDPYSAWARMAAMAATMAGIGILVSGIGGGSTVTQAEKDAAMGRSDYDDDSSKALANAFEDAQYPMLEVTNKMYKHIRNMDANFYGIARALNTQASMGGVDITGVNFADTYESGFLGFSSETITHMSSGIKFYEQALSELVDASTLEARAYTTSLVQKSSWFGFSTSEKIKTTYKDLPPSVMEDLASAFNDGYEAIMTAGVALGLDSTQLMIDLLATELNIGKIDFSELSPEEVSERLSQAYSTAFSDVIKGIDGLYGLVDRYATGSEYALETLGRIALEFDQASHMFMLIGKDFEDGSIIQVAKQFENIREVTEEQLSWWGSGGLDLTDFEGGSWLEGIYGKIKKLDESWEEFVFRMIGTTYTAQMQILDIVASTGGLQAFNDAMGAFMGNFYTDAEQLEFLQKSMAISFDTLGIAMPQTNDAFRSLLENMDTSTEEGAYLYGQVLLLAEGFATMTDASDSLLDSMNDYSEQIQAISDAWLGSLSYLTDLQKEDYANKVLALGLTDETGAINTVDAARAAAELAIRTTRTKEEYIPTFGRLITELEKEAEEATATDIVNKLDELIKEVIISKNATVDAYIHSSPTVIVEQA